MRLICPNCDAQYEVDASMLPPEGRDVQCSACGKVWFHGPAAAPTEASSGAGAPQMQPAPQAGRTAEADWARGAAPAPHSAPADEARFLSDEDLEEGEDDGRTPANPLEWQEAWDRALGKPAPAEAEGASPQSQPLPDVDEAAFEDFDDAEQGDGSRAASGPAAASAQDRAGLGAADADPIEAGYAEELEELSERLQEAPAPSRTEMAARRASAVLAQADPPAPAEASAPEQDLSAPAHEDAKRRDQAVHAPPATDEEPSAPSEAAARVEDEPFDAIPAERWTSAPRPFTAAPGLDEPRFDDSLQDQSPGEPVTTTARPDLTMEPEAQRGAAVAEPQDGLDPLDPEDFPTEALLRRLRRSRPELPPEEPEEEPIFDEIEGVDPLPRRPKLDEDKLALLREEAERETRARAAETARAAGRGLEMQPDLGLPEQEPPARLHIGPRSTAAEPEDGPAAPETAAAQSRSPRRELLPDIERINQTLSASGSARGKAELPPLAAAEAQRRGFRRGFMVALATAVLLALLYQNAPALAAKLPALDPVLRGYVALIDTARLGIDQVLRRLLGTPSL